MNDLLLRTLRGEATERRPLWIMRQAGRYLPEYRALRERFTFEELCARPDLAAEVTLMPIERFPLDAAIVFADIMTPLSALGIEVSFAPGPVVSAPLRSAADIDALAEMEIGEIAPTVMETLRLVGSELDGKLPVLGFCGGPWTLAAYLVQGEGKRGFPLLRALAAEDPVRLGYLLDKLTELAAAYLQAQIAAGAAAVQVFETWSGLLSQRDWSELVKPHIEQLLQRVGDDTPRLLFMQDATHLIGAALDLPADGYSVDWRVDLAALRQAVGPDKVLQGNLDPAVLLGGPDITRRAAAAMLRKVPAQGHVVNLGHGILPAVPIASVEALIAAVHAEATSSSGPGDGDAPGDTPGDAAGAATGDAAGAAAGAPLTSAITADLMRRYDKQGPRYTSYPTAIEFEEGLDAESYAGLLAAADERDGEPLSVYVHLPFCQERCLFCACHVIITPHYERALPYLELLRREIDMVAERLPHRRRISQLHLGGGTPTYHTPSDLAEVLDHLLERFPPREDAELAIEVDPRVTTFEHVDMLAARGFNRMSMGVQDFAPEVQEAVNRIQPVDLTRALIRHARGHGFAGINVDLIYGLPHQSLETFGETVDTVIDLGVDRLAVYSFAWVPWIRGHQTKISAEELPDRDVKLELFAMARERLLRAGYEAIGMDHFALPDDELCRARREHRLRRNFQGYSVIPASDVIGLGISAIGDVQGSYVQNEKKLSDYEEAVRGGRLPVYRGIARSPDDEVRREVIHELMCNFRVEPAVMEARHGIDFEEYFAEDLAALAAHEADGMVSIGDDAIEVTPIGELFVRNLALCFDRYRREQRQGEASVFSRTV